MKEVSLIILIAVINISCDHWPDIGSGYMVQQDARGYTNITDSLGTWLISGHVINFNFNKDFILVDQKPVDSICECNSNCYMKIPSNHSWQLQRCKEAFEHSNYHQFWIIDKNQPLKYVSTKSTWLNIFGPLSKDEFDKKVIEAGIPYKLIIEFEKNIK